jgi:limonene-1,2-epoxide hydrolase
MEEGLKRSPMRISRRQFAGSGLSTLVAVKFPSMAQAQAQARQTRGGTVSAAVEKANVAVVNQFCAAVGRRDLDAAVALLADNCTYRASQTRPPAVGKEAVTAAIKGFINRVESFTVLKTVALGPVVVNERDDPFAATATAPAVNFHVAAGVFFLENGKIVEWTDYIIA